MTTESPRLPLSLTVKEFTLDRLSCQILKTADGSFSLRVGSHSATLSEPMHSSKGAWSETLAIYLPALECSLPTRVGSLDRPESDQRWMVASVGLGLGYNEIITAALALRESLTPDLMHVESYEEHQELTDCFRKYFSERHTLHEDHPLRRVYADICRRTADFFEISEDTLHRFISKLLAEGQLILNSRLSAEVLAPANKPRAKFNCILFDAFSPASSPDLWEAHMLQLIVESMPAKSCVFVSYASRTVLKKILSSAGFLVYKRNGFAGKRESTFAVREERIASE